MIQVVPIGSLLSKALSRLAALYRIGLACDVFNANTVIAGWATGN